LSEADVAEFRERLCEAAARLFVERGPDAVTMRNLAGELGCSAMTPYRYFRDKDQILAAVRAKGFNDFAAALEEAARGPGDARARSAAVGAAYLRFAFDHPHFYRMMFDLHQPSDTADTELTRAGARARDTLTAHVDALIKAGLVSGDARRLGHMFWSAIHGVAMLKLAGLIDEDISPAELSGDLFEAVMRAHPGAAQ
jgi:AcrR family transcriptional regulator